MIQGWIWLVVAALVLLVAYQHMRFDEILRKLKKREELFQIVTENAADMIALVDMKGRRLYNSPAYKKILGYSPAELGETSSFEQIHPEDRFKVMEAGREARQSGWARKCSIVCGTRMGHGKFWNRRPARCGTRKAKW